MQIDQATIPDPAMAEQSMSDPNRKGADSRLPNRGVVIRDGWSSNQCGGRRYECDKRATSFLGTECENQLLKLEWPPLGGVSLLSVDLSNQRCSSRTYTSGLVEAEVFRTGPGFPRVPCGVDILYYTYLSLCT